LEVLRIWLYQFLDSGYYVDTTKSLKPASMFQNHLKIKMSFYKMEAKVVTLMSINLSNSLKIFNIRP